MLQIELLKELGMNRDMLLDILNKLGVTIECDGEWDIEFSYLNGDTTILWFNENDIMVDYSVYE